MKKLMLEIVAYMVIEFCSRSSIHSYIAVKHEFDCMGKFECYFIQDACNRSNSDSLHLKLFSRLAHLHVIIL